MSRFLNGLTEAQRRVVEATTGHLLVLAGPGSGKTHTVTAKIGHLFSIDAVPSPFRIAALTFTNAAAREMRARLRRDGFSDWDRLFCGTYHAFAQHLLSYFGRFVGIDEDLVVDPAGATAILEDTVARFPRFTASRLREEIDKLKRHGVLSSELPSPSDDYETDLAAAYGLYEKKKLERTLLDYSDLILWSSRLLATCPTIKDRVRNAYRYVIADEFQDTDSQQLDLVLALADGQASTVVADDDQSIYAWRGAVRANVVAIRQALGATQALLGTNFRSDQIIVEAALQVIATEPDHEPKELAAASKARGAISGSLFDTLEDEATEVAQRIALIRHRSLVKSEADIAIIARTHARAEQVLAALDSMGVPWFNRDRLKFDDSWDSQLALATLLATADPNSSEALRLLLISIEDGGIDRSMGGDALHLATALAHELASTGGPNSWSDPCALEQLLSKVRLWQWIGRSSSSASNARHRTANVKLLLLELARQVEANSKPLQCLRRFLGHDAVQVMTGHGSKGREFDAVFLLGLEDGTLPFYKAVNDEAQLAEERRIFYVALTRAKRLAVLTRVRNKNGRGQQRSRFLACIPAECFTDWPACLDALGPVA